MANDPYASFAVYPGMPFSNGKAVTPSDTVDLDTIPTNLHIGGGGDLVVTMCNGEKVTLKNIGVGSPVVGIISMRVTRIWATGTTCTGIVALW